MKPNPRTPTDRQLDALLATSLDVAPPAGLTSAILAAIAAPRRSRFGLRVPAFVENGLVAAGAAAVALLVALGGVLAPAGPSGLLGRAAVDGLAVWSWLKETVVSLAVSTVHLDAAVRIFDVLATAARALLVSSTADATPMIASVAGLTLLAAVSLWRAERLRHAMVMLSFGLGAFVFGAAGAPSSAAAKEAADDPVTQAEEEVLSRDTVEELERQMDEAEAVEREAARSGAEERGNEELLETYRQYKKQADRHGVHTSTERVEIGGGIVVEEGEVVAGDVVAFGGGIEIYGLVQGDAVSLGGDVTLHEDAQVMGDAVSFGGKVYLEEDHQVSGEIVSFDIGLGFPDKWGLRMGRGFQKPHWGFSLFFSLLYLGLIVLGGLLFYAIVGKRLEVVSRHIESEPGRNFLIGLLGAFATPVAFVALIILLIITVVGILLLPVVIPVVVILLLLAAFGGVLGAALAVGRRVLAARADSDVLSATRSPYFVLFVGLASVYGVHFLGRVCGLIPVLGPVAFLLKLLGLFIVVFASLIGYGALITSRGGRTLTPQPAGPGGAPPALPPMPASPGPPPTPPVQPTPSPEPPGPEPPRRDDPPQA